MKAQNPNAQNMAADPKASAFLTANAGSGKTSTLVNRVARLLLNGAKPERILCVTYTKAAAAEMQERLFDQLGKWAVRSDEELRADLERIDETPHDLPRDLSRARALFAKALETPGGLKIQTLHGFCEKLLRRFPLEAGLSPAFQVLDDLIGSELAAKASADLLTLEATEYEGVTEARARLIRKLKVSGFERLLSQFIHQHDDLKAAFEGLMAQRKDWALGIFQSLGLDELTSPEAVIDDYEMSLYWPGIENLARSMATTEGAYNQKTSGKLLAVIEAHNAGQFDLQAWYKCFYTDKGTFSSHTYSSKASEADKQELHRLAEAVPGVIDRARAAEIAGNTLDALLLFHAFSGIYQDRKGREGALDFQDLINKAKDLLSRGDMATWVLFKLDGGLEHILVDEAQDTSEDQWVIVRALAEDFFSGRGQSSDSQLRTVFAVGDEKQSIYGFQGARPDKFSEARQYFIGRAVAAGQSPRVPELILSYRTLPEILGFVDAVYDAQDLSHALTLDYNHRITHEAFRLKEKGLVELWPLVQPIDAPEVDADDANIAPVDAGSRDPAAKRLARQLAATIRSEIAAGRVVFSKNGEPRPLHAGDVLILVRKRDALFEHIIRELKIAGVPVSGADRLKLGDHIAFQDLRALMRFCLQPNDSLSLACVLRSPLCDLSEDDLYALAQGREGPLWGRLLDHDETDGLFANARVFLLWAHGAARHLTAFDFLARVLNRRDGGGRSIKQRFLTRLGDECEDVLEETLALALKGEGIGLNGLSACLDLFEFRAAQIKREQEEGGRSVRVMTVHGSKGLEAPWVILPIGPQHTSASKDDLLMRDDDGHLYLCAGGRKSDTDAISQIRAGKSLKDEQEGLRLLYVALTRARDRLTLCGYAGKRAAPKGAAFDPWYDLLVNAFDRVEHSLEAMSLKAPFDDLEQTKTAVIRVYGQRSATLAAEAAIVPPEVVLPGFVTQIVAQSEVDLERGRERWAAISQMGDEDREEEERAPSPLDSRNGLGRYRRGNLIHKLFEILPDIATEKRGEVTARYLDRQPDLNSSQRQEMAGAVMAVLTDPRFAEAFGPDSRPEVALAGSIGRSARGDEIMLSGRIDRLVVTDDRVLIIDYKSNRPAPDRAEDAAIAYQRQLAGYVALLRQIYPQKTIEAALLWTDGPKLTPLSEALVNLRLDEILLR